MRIQIGRPSLLGAAAAIFALAAILCVVAFRYSIYSAVPAGAQHVLAADPPDDGSNNAGAQHVLAAAAASPDDATDDPSANNFVSTKFMTRGYCYAGSQLKDTKAPGGFGKSDNVPRKVLTRSDGRGLYLLAQPGIVVPIADGPGMRVVLVNQTQDLLAFDASDSRVAITQEAQDTDGTWKPIEYLPSSWCGNSYHRVFLAPHHFWSFPAPRYKGAIQTQLRFAMTLADGSHLHSNVFDGSVNREQFSVKQGHTATQLMDPYDE